MDRLPSHSALSTDEESSGPAPRNERHLTLFRVGSLLLGDRRELCLVKNVFARGAQIRSYCDLSPGQEVSLELNENQPIAGRIAGTSGADTRIEFDRSVDVLALLKVGTDGPAPRKPRVKVHAFGLLRQGAVTHRVAIDNISQGGVGVRCDADLAVGKEATVTLGGLPPQPSVIRWARSGAYGVTFNAVVGLPSLVEWLHTHSEAQQPAA